MRAKKKKQLVTRDQNDIPSQVARVSDQDGFFGMMERLATNKDVDVDKMAKMLDMQERVIDKQSEQAFNQAMVLTQADMPAIQKTSANKQTSSFYATLDKIIMQITPVYTANGFSVSFNTDQSPVGDDFVRVIAYVSHAEGHTRNYQHDLPIDDKGIKGTANKTGVHGRASTITYAQRYLLCLIFNVATGTDIDGNKRQAEDPTISAKLLHDLLFDADFAGKSEEECLAYVNKISNTDHIRLSEITENQGLRLAFKIKTSHTEAKK